MMVRYIDSPPVAGGIGGGTGKLFDPEAVTIVVVEYDGDEEMADEYICPPVSEDDITTIEDCSETGAESVSDVLAE